MEPRRATLVDIAAAARVSKTTVDRVLNGRDGVKPRTRARVVAVAVELGYLSSAEAAELDPTAEAVIAPPRPETAAALDFVLPGGSNTFISQLTAALAEAAAGHGVAARVRSIAGFDPEAMTATLAGIASAGDSAGVGVIGLDHPMVREALRGLSRAGVPVLTLVSDISAIAGAGYVGIDNRAAGRLAGYLLGRFVGERPGAVALFAGALAYRGHEEREMGFRHVLAERFPHLSIAEHREIQDDPARAYDEARAVLAARPDLVGLYNIGAGNRGIGRALAESGRADRLVFVGHDLSEHTRGLLVSGLMDAVLDQNPRAIGRTAVARLLAAGRGEALPPLPPLPVTAIFGENIPPDAAG